MNTRTQIWIVLAAVVVFGILVPWYKGLDFLDPRLIVAYACLSAVFIAPAGASAFAASQRPALPTVLLLSAYGFGFSVASLASGLFLVNVLHWHGRLLLPRATLLLSALFLSAAAAVCVTAMAAFLSRYLSAQAIKTLFRLAFVIVIVALIVLDRGMPEATAVMMTTSGITRIALIAAIVLTVAAAPLMFLAVQRRQMEQSG